MLTSLNNERVKLVRSLQSQRKARDRENLFVVEGVRLAEEAATSGWAAQWVFFTAAADARAQAAVARLRESGAEAVEVSEQVMRACADTEHPQPVLAVLTIPASVPAATKLGGTPLTLICDGIADPGNLGTLLRAAAAAGATEAILAPDTVDAYNPKVVRAGMGAHFRLAVHSLGWDEIAPRAQSLAVRLADSGGGRQYDLLEWRIGCALIVCNEGAGASEAARRLASETVFIPMANGTESLNAALAGGIILFEAARQRRTRLG